MRPSQAWPPVLRLWQARLHRLTVAFEKATGHDAPAQGDKQRAEPEVGTHALDSRRPCLSDSPR